MRVRQTADKLWIPRPNIGIEKDLDSKYERTGPLEWQIPADQMPTVLKPDAEVKPLQKPEPPKEEPEPPKEEPEPPKEEEPEPPKEEPEEEETPEDDESTDE